MVCFIGSCTLVNWFNTPTFRVDFVPLARSPPLHLPIASHNTKEVVFPLLCLLSPSTTTSRRKPSAVSSLPVVLCSTVVETTPTFAIPFLHTRSPPPRPHISHLRRNGGRCNASTACSCSSSNSANLRPPDTTPLLRTAASDSSVVRLAALWWPGARW